MKKELFLDTETTGLNEDAAIVQIAGIIVIDNIVKEEFNIKLKPHPGATISEEALKVTGLTREEINSYENSYIGMLKFESILSKYIDKYDKNDKYTLIGQNTKFDFEKLIQFYERKQNPYLGSFINFKTYLDTLYIVKTLQFIDRLPYLENNKLSTWCEYFNIELGDNAHDALADIRATRELFIKVIDLLEGDNK